MLVTEVAGVLEEPVGVSLPSEGRPQGLRGNMSLGTRRRRQACETLPVTIGTRAPVPYDTGTAPAPFASAHSKAGPRKLPHCTALLGSKSTYASPVCLPR